jgi:hypothetical protein
VTRNSKNFDIHLYSVFILSDISDEVRSKLIIKISVYTSKKMFSLHGSTS